MPFIKLGTPSWNLLYFPLFPICETIKIEFITYLRANQIAITPIWYAFMPLFSELIVGLPFIYVLVRKQIEKNKQKQKKRVNVIVFDDQKFIKVHYDTSKYQLVWNILALIIISSIQSIVKWLLAFTSSTYGILDYPGRPAYESQSTLAYGTVPVTFLTITLINYFILHTPFYRHRTYSLIIIAIGMIIQISPLMQYEYKLEIKLPLFCLVYILNAIQFVSEKWLMNKKYYSVFGLLFFEGFIGIIFTIMIAYLIDATSPSAKALFGGAQGLWQLIGDCLQAKNNINLDFIGMIILNCVSAFAMMQIKYHYTPMHCGISNFLCGIGVWIVLLVQGLTLVDFAGVILFGHLLVLVGILIYTEIIILYVCGLETNTTKEINYRSQFEFDDAVNRVNKSQELLNISFD